MKPDWDKLMGAFKGHPTSLVADVDCTAAGQSICQKHGVQGYPTLKYGDPKKLKDYQGGRDYDSLKSFAESSLGPKCNADNLKLCKKEIQEEYQKYLDMSVDSVEAEVRTKRKDLSKLEDELKIIKDAARFLRKQAREKKAAERKAEKEKKKADDAAKASKKAEEDAAIKPEL